MLYWHSARAKAVQNDLQVLLKMPTVFSNLLQLLKRPFLLKYSSRVHHKNLPQVHQRHIPGALKSCCMNSEDRCSEDRPNVAETYCEHPWKPAASFLKRKGGGLRESPAPVFCMHLQELLRDPSQNCSAKTLQALPTSLSEMLHWSWEWFEKTCRMSKKACGLHS